LFWVAVSKSMTHAIVHFVLTTGYGAIFLLMVAESAALPIPSEIVMPLGGALANGTVVATVSSGDQPLNLAVVVAAGVGGNLVGSWIGYVLGRTGGRPLMRRLDRFPWVGRDHLDRTTNWFERRGRIAVLIGRVVPIVRTFISVPAGVARMPLGSFTLLTAIGCIPWSVALALAGYLLGSQWRVVEGVGLPVTIGVGALLVSLVVIWFVRHKRRMTRSNAGRSSRANRSAPTERAA
jgi:membrane protein DedA with SNARE-associated domain